MPLAWKDRVQQAIAAGGTGTLTLGAASSGYQALGAADDGKTFPGVVVDGSAWETGLYTYTHASTSLARTAFYASSTGSALNASTSATWIHDLTALGAASFDNGTQAAAPGGRLTLVSGDPEPLADVVGAATLYYTPAVSSFIPLWDGQRWRVIEFGEVSLPGSGLTGTVPHDVFGVLSAGQLALEFVPWTSNSARASPISIQGRYVRSSDKSRLLLGSVKPSGTGVFTDSFGGGHQSGGRRLVWNMHNRRSRPMLVIDTTNNWSYLSATVRAANGSINNFVDFMSGLPSRVTASAHGTANLVGNSARAAKIGIGVDSSTAFAPTCVVQAGYCASGNIYSPLTGTLRTTLAAGYHFLYWLESGADGTCTWIGDNGGDGQQAGMTVELEA